jgi:superfamily II DNA or RNA helicase
MIVEALFGPVIHVTTYQEAQSRGNVVPIIVVMRSVLQGPGITSFNSTVINRHGIWRNEIRNRLIASDMASFTKNGEQLLVSVGVVEHGLELLRFAPGTPFVYSNMDLSLRKRYEDKNVIQKGQHPITLHDRERMQSQFERGELRCAISTCWKRGVDFKQLQVLIRADGTASGIDNIQLPGRLSRTFEGKECGVLVDYLDEFHPTLNRRAKDRMKDYRKRGWPVIMPKQIGES